MAILAVLTNSAYFSVQRDGNGKVVFVTLPCGPTQASDALPKGTNCEGCDMATSIVILVMGLLRCD
jgi:hypothetical protein